MILTVLRPILAGLALILVSATPAHAQSVPRLFDTLSYRVPALMKQESLMQARGGPFWSRCDHRGEGLILGAAIGLGWSLIEGKFDAVRVAVTAAGGWLFGRFLWPPKAACRDDADT